MYLAIYMYACPRDNKILQFLPIITLHIVTTEICGLNYTNVKYIPIHTSSLSNKQTSRTLGSAARLSPSQDSTKAWNWNSDNFILNSLNFTSSFYCFFYIENWYTVTYSGSTVSIEQVVQSGWKNKLIQDSSNGLKRQEFCIKFYLQAICRWFLFVENTERIKFLCD